MIGFLFKLTIRLALLFIVLYGAVELLDSIQIIYEIGSEEDFWNTFLTIFFFFVILEIIVFPILDVLSIPFNIFTLGLASIIIHAVVLYVLANTLSDFVITNFLSAILLAFALTLARGITK